MTDVAAVAGNVNYLRLRGCFGQRERGGEGIQFEGPICTWFLRNVPVEVGDVAADAVARYRAAGTSGLED
jgi:hypothetical protein